MKYRFYLTFILVVILTACSQDKASASVTIGFVNLTPALDPIIDGIKSGLIDLGYEEGENVTFIYEGATGSIDQLPAAVQYVLEQDVDLLISISTPATFAAKAELAGTETPLLFVPTYDPVSNGIVESIALPGGPYTGIQTIGFIPKQLEWLVEIKSDIRYVFVPHNPNDGASLQGLETLRVSAERLNVELLVAPASNPDELLALLETVPENADALLMLPDGLISSHLDHFVETGLRLKLPVSAINPSHTEAGSLMSFGWGLYEVGASQVARMANQILQGTPAEEIPVETSEFFLTINMETANAIGLNIEDSILSRAKILYR